MPSTYGMKLMTEHISFQGHTTSLHCYIELIKQDAVQK